MSEQRFPATVVTVAGQPTAGIHSEYRISECDQASGQPNGPAGQFGRIQFQSGPLVANRPNGCTEEDVLGVLLHRINALQASDQAHDGYARALMAIDSALFWLNQRHKDKAPAPITGIPS